MRVIGSRTQVIYIRTWLKVKEGAIYSHKKQSLNIRILSHFPQSSL